MRLPTRPSRRARRAGVAVLAAASLALLAACGDGGSAADDAAGSGDSASSAFPVSIENAFGTAEIPKEPQRIVTVGLMEQDALLALGKVPVATTEWFGKKPGAIWPWAEDELGGAARPEVLSNVDGLQFEKIASLKPDLIIGLYSGLTAEDYAKLSKIAPTVAQPKGGVDYGISWQDLTTTVGKAIGKAGEAEALVSGTEAKIAETAAKYPQFKGKTGMVGTRWEGFYVYGPDDIRSRFMEALGFTLPAGLQEVVGEEFGANLSRERVDLLDTDALIWLVTSYDKDGAELKADTLYAKLPVHTQGRDVLIEDGEITGSALSFLTVLSLPMLLEELPPLLANAVDGDPATAVGRAAAS